MIQINNSLLQELGLGTLPEGDKKGPTPTYIRNT